MMVFLRRVFILFLCLVMIFVCSSFKLVSSVGAENVFYGSDSNYIVEAGDKISVPSVNGKKKSQCSLGAVINNDFALTAAHCGSRGQPVNIVQGRIGYIVDYVADTDVAVIKLNDNFPKSFSKIADSLPLSGEEIFKRGSEQFCIN